MFGPWVCRSWPSLSSRNSSSLVVFPGPVPGLAWFLVVVLSFFAQDLRVLCVTSGTCSFFFFSQNPSCTLLALLALPCFPALRGPLWCSLVSFATLVRALWPVVSSRCASYVSVSSHRCRCSARFLDYMYSWEADFQGSSCLPEDCVFVFQFWRTGLRYVALMSRLCGGPHGVFVIALEGPVNSLVGHGFFLLYHVDSLGGSPCRIACLLFWESRRW